MSNQWEENDFQEYVLRLNDKTRDDIFYSCETVDLPEEVETKVEVKEDSEFKISEFTKSYNSFVSNFNSLIKGLATAYNDLVKKYKKLFSYKEEILIVNTSLQEEINELKAEIDNLKKGSTERITYDYLKKNYPTYMHFIKCGRFYKARYKSAEFLNVAFGYKLFLETRPTWSFSRVAAGFEERCLSKVLSKLNEYNAKYVIVSDYRISTKNDKGQDISDSFENIPKN